MIKHVNPAGAPAPQFYSHVVEASEFKRIAFISGQVGVAPDGTVPEGIAEQTTAAVNNLKAALAAVDMDVSNVAKFTIYLTDPGLMEGFTAAGAPLLSRPPAATTLLFVKALASPALLVEIEAVAVQ